MFIVIISFLVLWLLGQIIDNFIYRNKDFIWHKLEYIVFFTYSSKSYETRFFDKSPSLEAGWTIIPIYILIGIAGPSFFYLYLSEEALYTLLTVKAQAYQWYWTYDFTDLFPTWFSLKRGGLDRDDYVTEAF